MAAKNSALDLPMIVKEASFLYPCITLFVSRSIFEFFSIQMLFGGMALGFLLFFFILFSSKKVDYRLFLVLFLCCIVGIQSAINSGAGDGKLFIPLMVCAIALSYQVLLCRVSTQFSTGLFFAVFVIFWVKLYLAGGDVNFVFRGSRNQVSVVFLVLSVFANFNLRIHGSKPKISIAVACVVACIVAVGISGIIASLFLLVSVVYARYFANLRYAGAIFVCLMLSIMAIPIVFSADQLNMTLASLGQYFLDIDKELLYKLDMVRLLGHDVRNYIWAEYYSSLDVMQAIYGRSLSATYLGVANLHSSYLMLHARAGWLSMVVIGFILFKLVSLFRHDYFIAALLLGLLIRAYSDTIFFGVSTYDWVLLSLLLWDKSLLKQPGDVK